MKRVLAVGCFSALLVALSASCSSDSESGGDGQATGGVSPSGGAAAEGGAGGSGTGSTAQTGGKASTGGNASGGATEGGAGGAQGGAGGSPAVEGEPCPNGDECDDGLVCVGYGNPLPNGESTACRLVCDAQDPPPNCDCTSGWCAPIEDPYVNGCADMLENAACADAKAGTLDFESPHYLGCGHWTDLGNGEGWVEYGETLSQGFAVDQKTGLGWLMRPNEGPMTLAQVEAFCADLNVQGLDAWRVPTIDEARSLAAGCSATAPGGTCPLSDSTCLTASCGLSNQCTSCTWGDGPKSGSYCRPEATVCGGFHTTSTCSDCMTPGNWSYGPGNGNFFSNAATNQAHAVCVMSNVPNGVPCAD